MKKKTIISAISGAVAGSLITAVITLSTVGTVDVEKTEKKASSAEDKIVARNEKTENSMPETVLLAEGTEKKELSVEEIAKQVGPSIVGISCETTIQSYFGTQTGESGGSGIIINDKGNIVTNYHVIEGSSKIKVKLNSGNEYDAQLIGGDEKTDIAVLKINAAEELHVATLGNSDEVEVGSLAVAIGNPLANELFGTVTAGVISGVNRSVTIGEREMTLIQTDAAISPGNSGGALINKYGEIIGINTVKMVDDAAEGLGFAIPMNAASVIMEDLIEYGYVKGRPVIGISVREITKELAYYNNLLVDHGLYVMGVTEGSGAEQAGIKRGDIIVKIDGKEITSASELNKIRDKYKAGDKIKMLLIKRDREVNVTVTLKEDIPAGQIRE